MSQTYGTTVEVSVDALDELFPIITKNTETDIRRYLIERGYEIVGDFSHSKNVHLRNNSETAETYEIGVIWTSVRFK